MKPLVTIGQGAGQKHYYSCPQILFKVVALITGIVLACVAIEITTGGV